jgi:hypothetical protein
MMYNIFPLDGMDNMSIPFYTNQLFDTLQFPVGIEKHLTIQM